MYVRAVTVFDKCVQGGSLKEVHFVDVNSEMVKLIQNAFREDWNNPLDEKTIKEHHSIIKNMQGSYYSISAQASGDASRATGSTSKLSSGSAQPSGSNVHGSATKSVSGSDLSESKTHSSDGKVSESTQKSIHGSLLSASGSTLPDIVIFKGSIIESKADAMVCWQDVKISGKFMVAKAVAEVAGDDYQKAVKSSTVNKIDCGHVFHTTGGNLQMLVIHAVVSDTSSEGELEDIPDFNNIVTKILSVADAWNLSTVVFPVLMTRKGK